MQTTEIRYGKGTKNIANTEEGADSGNLIEVDCNGGFVSNHPEGLMKHNSRINLAYMIFKKSCILVWEFERDAKCLMKTNENESNILFVQRDSMIPRQEHHGIWIPR